MVKDTINIDDKDFAFLKNRLFELSVENSVVRFHLNEVGFRTIGSPYISKTYRELISEGSKHSLLTVLREVAKSDARFYKDSGLNEDLALLIVEHEHKESENVEKNKWELLKFGSIICFLLGITGMVTESKFLIYLFFVPIVGIPVFAMILGTVHMIKSIGWYLFKFIGIIILIVFLMKACGWNLETDKSNGYPPEPDQPVYDPGY